jgi:hypothetical protein
VPPYGGAIVQTVFYADSDLCDPLVNNTKGFPERFDERGKLPWSSPYILMVDRGGCTFVQKVRNAQRTGAAGVLIADNTCLCIDMECMSNTDMRTCENTEPIVADDGSGSDISIPSFLMFKRDADSVKNELKANRPVQIEMAWSLPNTDDRVEYNLWTTPADTFTLDFFDRFAPLAAALKEHAYFTPHMYIHNGFKMNCQSAATGEDFCYSLCTNNGRYCATDPDNDLDKGISGADVVTESLRRLCIWELYGVSDGIGMPWWDYVREFNIRCRDTDYFNDDDCIKDVYKHAKVDGQKVKECMSKDGTTSDNKVITKLAGEITAQEQRGVVVIPTAFVNTVAIRGSLSASTVFSAICAGYSAGTAPDICKKCGSCPDAPACAEDGYCKAKGWDGSASQLNTSSGVSKKTFVKSMILVAASMLLIVALFGGIGMWYYKKTQDDMLTQVRGIWAEYLPLEDQDAIDGGSSPLDLTGGGMGTSLMS